MSDARPWTKPVVILVPGAWSTPGSFNLLTPLLHAAGYRTRCVHLPSVGAQPPVDDLRPDIDAIRSVISEEVRAAQDVLLLMHDYASIPGGEAIRDLDKATRLRNGLEGGITCLFYAAAPLLPSGSCLADLLREEDHPWIRTSQDKKVAVLDDPINIFCPEVEPDLAKEYTDSLKPHSYQTFFSKTTWEPFKEIPFFYLFCKLDKVIKLEKQKNFAAEAQVKFKSTTIASGHCPFITAPEDMAKAIRRAAKESTYYSGVIARDYASHATS